MTELKRGLADVFFDRTRITEISPEGGTLRHRGYSIDEIAGESFEKTLCLLLDGEWPDEGTYRCTRERLAGLRALPAGISGLVRDLVDAPPHALVRTAISFAGCSERPLDLTDVAAVRARLERLICLVPRVLVAQAALRDGRPIPAVDTDMDHSTAFLSGVLGRRLSRDESEAINSVLVLHADHGSNASAFAARVAVSTEADLESAFCAAISTFAGPLHGGAVAGVLATLDRVTCPSEVKAFVAAQRASHRPVPGFGHRVYRGIDPRLPSFRALAERLVQSDEGRRDLELLDTLVEEMEAFRRFGIGPNVDLYAALVYRLLGFSDDFAISIYIAGRCAGWSAQILEQLENNILIRPRLAYEGSAPRRLRGAATRHAGRDLASSDVPAVVGT